MTQRAERPGKGQHGILTFSKGCISRVFSGQIYSIMSVRSGFESLARACSLSDFHKNRAAKFSELEKINYSPNFRRLNRS